MIVISIVGLNFDLVAQTSSGSAESALLQATGQETLILRGEKSTDSTAQPSAGITWQLNSNSRDAANLIENKWSIYQSGGGNVLTIGGYYGSNSSKALAPQIKINDYTANTNLDGNITFYTYDFTTNTNSRPALTIGGASGQVIIGNPNSDVADSTTLLVYGNISATGSVSASDMNLENVSSIDYGKVIVGYDGEGRRLVSAKNPEEHVNGGWYSYDDDQQKTNYYKKITYDGHSVMIGSNLYVFNSAGKIQKPSPLGDTKIITPSDTAINVSRNLLNEVRLFVQKAVWSEDYFISEKVALASDMTDQSDQGSMNDNNGQPDYVFYEDYSLPSLEKLEQYVKTNHHLPDVPSINEIKDKGYLSLLSQTTGTLKNLEEQVLHNIAQEKKIALHEEKIRLQEQRLKAQEKLIQSLITRIEKLEIDQK